MLSPHVPELSALQVLLAVSEHGSLRSAAAVVGLTQQAVSLRVRSMEAQVGVPLLVRSTSGSVLTPAGRLVAHWASEVLDRAERLDAGIASLRSDRAYRLRIAASLTIAEHLVPGWLVALRLAQTHSGAPVTAVELRAVNSTGVAAQVGDGAVDLGFVEGPRAPRALRSRVVARDRLVLVVAPGHPWSCRAEVPGAELAATPLIVREEGSGTRRFLAAALGRLPGVEVADPVMEVTSTAAVRAAVAAGTGPGVLSALAVSDDLVLGRLVAVAVADVDLRRDLRAVWRAGNHPPAGPARALVGIARRAS